MVRLCLEIADGRGEQPVRTTNTTVTADMGWRVHSAFAVLAWQGKVSFNIQIYGAAQGVTLEVGWVSIAAIGGDAA